MSIMVICIAVIGGLYFYIQDKHDKRDIAKV